MALSRTAAARIAPPAAFIMLQLAAGAALASPEAARGERIFHGREAVAGRLDGHDRPLPAALGKCVACHRAAQPGGLQENLAPPLGRDFLTAVAARRGGKPYAYDRESFCSTVRTGIDPQYVIMLRAMPRFDISPEQCAALWSYLTETKHDRQR